MPLKFFQNFNAKAEQQPLLGLVVYSLINFLRPAIYIILTPVYLHYLTTEEYGLHDMLLIIGAFVMILCTLRLNASMLTCYYDYLGDREKIKKYLRNVFSFSILIALVIGAFFTLAGDWIFTSLFHSEEIRFHPYGLIVLMAVLILEINTTYFIYLRNEKDLVSYVQVIGAQILMTIALQLIFVLLMDLKVLGLILGSLIGNALVFILILIKEPGILTLDFDKSMIWKSLRFSVALIPYLIIYWVLTKGGKFVLERYSELSIVAVFALMVTLANVIILLVDAVINGLRPFLFEIFAADSNGQEDEKVSLLTKMIVNIPLFIIPLIVLVGSNLWLFTSKTTYHVIDEYITWLALTTFVLVYAKLFYQQLVFSKKSGVVTLLSFVVMIVLVYLFYSLVPEKKIWGVLFASIIANALMALLFYLAGQKYQHINYNPWTILGMPLIFFLLLFGLEYVCVEMMEMKRSLFGVVQFISLTLVVMLMNYRSIGEYKTLFSSSVAIADN